MTDLQIVGEERSFLVAELKSRIERMETTERDLSRSTSLASLGPFPSLLRAQAG